LLVKKREEHSLFGVCLREQRRGRGARGQRIGRGVCACARAGPARLRDAAESDRDAKRNRGAPGTRQSAQQTTAEHGSLEQKTPQHEEKEEPEKKPSPEKPFCCKKQTDQQSTINLCAVGEYDALVRDVHVACGSEVQAAHSEIERATRGDAAQLALDSSTLHALQRDQSLLKLQHKKSLTSTVQQLCTNRNKVKTTNNRLDETTTFSRKGGVKVESGVRSGGLLLEGVPSEPCGDHVAGEHALHRAARLVGQRAAQQDAQLLGLARKTPRAQLAKSIFISTLSSVHIHRDRAAATGAAIADVVAAITDIVVVVATVTVTVTVAVVARVCFAARTVARSNAMRRQQSFAAARRMHFNDRVRRRALSERERERRQRHGTTRRRLRGNRFVGRRGQLRA
jgi:hypothetical protein